MRLSDKRIQQRLNGKVLESYTEHNLKETTDRAKNAFYQNEGSDLLSKAEFIAVQSRYIHKRWWLIQASILAVLWGISGLNGFNGYLQRCMGIAASLFAVLVMPELWKNRKTDAMEIECAAYFTLRQVYAARIYLFALVDLLLISGFAVVGVMSERMLLQNMIIHFLLPYVATCCICFRCLYSQKIGSEYFTIFLCFFWTAVWTQIVLHEKVYMAVSLPVWYGMLTTAICYLGYCIYRGQRTCGKIWEAKPLWSLK